MTANELQPDVEEVLQVEPDGYEPTVKVSQQGPVRVQQLPRKAGSTRTVPAVAVMPSPYHLLRPNPRRASAVIIADAAILVGYGNAAATDASTMAKWPANLPLTVCASIDVWVAAQTGTANVSVLAEYWATGEGDE